MYYIYLISANVCSETCYKIGRTKRDPNVRLKELKTGNSSELQVVKYFKSPWGPKIESSLHRQFRDKKISGEWFLLDRNDVDLFESKCENLHNNFTILKANNTWIQDTKSFSF